MLRAYCNIIMVGWTDWIVGNTRHVAYLARYAPGLRDTDMWPMSKLLAYVKMTSDIVDKENKAANPKSK